MKADDLQGFVDFFDGHVLCGWALDRSDLSRTLSVDLFVDDLFVVTIPASDYREDLKAVVDSADKSFRYVFDPPLCAQPPRLDLPAIPKITVKFSGTDRPLLVIKDLLGIVNVDSVNWAEQLCLSSDNRFLPTPPRKMIEHVAGRGASASDYRAVGLYVLLDLLAFGLLTERDGTIVDVGCGSGRVAAHLATYLSEKGGYHGFDTWQAGVEWAAKEIGAKYRNFQFRALRSDDSRRRDPGYVGESAYDIPLPDGSCDLVLASSVLTHLTYPVALEYLREFRRLLRADGRAYVTVFIFDREAEERLSGRRLRRDTHGAYYDHRDFFDTYFTEDSIAELLAAAELEALVKRYGLWRGDAYAKRRPVGHQDLLILRRRP